jgi:hypothetical protein
MGIWSGFLNFNTARFGSPLFREQKISREVNVRLPCFFCADRSVRARLLARLSLGERRASLGFSPLRSLQNPLLIVGPVIGPLLDVCAV